MRIKRGIGWLSLVAAAIILLLLVAAPSHAQQQPASSCANYPGLTNHIAGCIRDTLDTATGKYFDVNTGFYPLISRGITGVFILAVSIFGVMASFGMLEKVGRDSIMLLLKIACVSYFATNSDFMYHSVIKMMDATAQSVVGFVPANGQSDSANGDFSQITCLKKMINAQQGTTGAAAVAGPWLAMDCILDSVVGIKIEPKSGKSLAALSPVKAYNDKLNDKDKGLSRGLLYLFFSAWQSSVMGAILAVVGLIFVWGLINIIIKALFIYIAGYLGLAVMMMVSPLFIPMVLFQSTKVYFDKWVKLIISFALQPIIILVFVALTISAVDLATFSGKYSVMYRIAGDESQQNGFSLNSYLTKIRSASGQQGAIIQKEQVELARIKGDTKDNTPIESVAQGGLIDGIVNSKCTKALMAADADLKQKCDQSYPMSYMRDKLDWDLLGDVRSPAVIPAAGVQNKGEQIAKEVLSAIIFAAVVVFVMNQLLSVIPMVAYDLIGDFGQSPNLGAVAGNLPGQRGARQGLQSLVSGRGGAK